MKPLDDMGRELDAIFTVEPTALGAHLIVESRGGAARGPRPPRNADYAAGLELLLRRLGTYGATLVHVEVYSQLARSLPPEQRRIAASGFAFPLHLSGVADISKLRLQLGSACAAFGRYRTTGGNSTKKLRLTLDWSTVIGQTASELEDLLAGIKYRLAPQSDDALKYARLGSYLLAVTEDQVRLKLSKIAEILGTQLPLDAWTPQFWANTEEYHRTRRGQWLNAGFHAFYERRTESVSFRRVATSQLEAPTDDPDELRIRASIAKRKILTASGVPPPPPPGSVDVEERSFLSTRFLRDPKVVGWVAAAAKGVCEACHGPAPFLDGDGEPYLEVHHVRPLGEGGPDVIDNAVAVCPACHRRLHYGEDRDSYRKDIIDNVERLRDYPGRRS